MQLPRTCHQELDVSILKDKALKNMFYHILLYHKFEYSKKSMKKLSTRENTALQCETRVVPADKKVKCFYQEHEVRPWYM